MALSDDAALVRRFLAVARLAVVGLSDDPLRPSRQIARYLIGRNREVVPVNPNYETVLDRPCYASLADIPVPPLLAVVFRKAEHCPEVVRDAIKAGVNGIWLQTGIVSKPARHLARDHGIDFIEDRCIKVEMMLARR